MCSGHLAKVQIRAKDTSIEDTVLPAQLDLEANHYHSLSRWRRPPLSAQIANTKSDSNELSVRLRSYLYSLVVSTKYCSSPKISVFLLNRRLIDSAPHLYRTMIMRTSSPLRHQLVGYRDTRCAALKWVAFNQSFVSLDSKWTSSLSSGRLI